MRALFTLPYAPGVLEAAALDADGRELARASLTSAQGPLHWTLRPDAPLHKGKAVFIEVTLTDDAGNVECNADATLTLRVDGGELLGFGSAEPRTACEFAAGEYPTLYGRALAAVRPAADTMTLALYCGGALVCRQEFTVE